MVLGTTAPQDDVGSIALLGTSPPREALAGYLGPLLLPTAEATAPPTADWSEGWVTLQAGQTPPGARNSPPNAHHTIRPKTTAADGGEHRSVRQRTAIRYASNRITLFERPWELLRPSRPMGPTTYVAKLLLGVRPSSILLDGHGVAATALPATKTAGAIGAVAVLSQLAVGVATAAAGHRSRSRLVLRHLTGTQVDPGPAGAMAASVAAP